MSDYDDPQIRSAIATVLRRYADEILSGATRVVNSKFERLDNYVRFELEMADPLLSKKAPERPPTTPGTARRR